MHAHYDINGLAGGLLQFSIATIMLGYIAIAVQFWRRYKLAVNPATRAQVEVAPASAFLQLMGIFILCSATGYLPRLWQMPDGLFVALHITLALVTVRYVLKRNAEKIASALARA